MSTVLTLPPELTIYGVAELRPQWLAWVDTGRAADAPPRAEVDGSQVLDVDGAGLQLLLSLAGTLEREGRSLALTAPSATLAQACQALGLDALLARGEGAAQ